MSLIMNSNENEISISNRKKKPLARGTGPPHMLAEEGGEP